MSGKDSDTFFSKSPTPPDESKDEVGRPSRLVNLGRLVVKTVIHSSQSHLPLQMSAEMKWEGRVGK